MIIGGGSALASQGGQDHKVTICHCRFNEGHDDYVKITVDKASIYKKGHGNHADDIIPAFSYVDNKGVEHTFGGQGDQSLLPSCEKPGTTTTTVPDEPEEPTTTTTVPDEPEEPTTTTTVPDEPEEPTTTTTVPDEPEEPTTTTTLPDEPEEPTTVPTVPEEPTTVPTVPETNPPTTEPETRPTVITPADPVDPATPADPTEPTVEATTAQQFTGTLPETGSTTSSLLIAGFGALLAGLGLVQLASSRRGTAARVG